MYMEVEDGLELRACIHICERWMMVMTPRAWTMSMDHEHAPRACTMSMDHEHGP